MACWNDYKDLASMPFSWRHKVLSEMADAQQPCILTEVKAPGNIIAVNAEWSKLCGYSPEDALGKPTTILQGRLTSTHKARQFAHSCMNTTLYGTDTGFASRRACVTTKLVNYTKHGRPFIHCLKAKRVMDEDTGVEYYMTESHEETDEKICRAMLRGEYDDDAKDAAAQRRGAMIYAATLLAVFIPALYPMWSNLLPGTA